MSEHNAKDALLRATAEIVAECGLDNFSMKKVTNRAGVSEALVYKHFQTKENLLNCCFVKIHTEIGDRFRSLKVLNENPTQEDVYQAARLCWMLYFDALVKQGSQTIFYFAYRDSNYVHDIQAHDEEARRSYFKEFVDFFDQLDASFHIYRKVSGSHLWTYILDTSGVFAKRVIRGELPNTPESIEDIWRLIFGGIAQFLQP